MVFKASSGILICLWITGTLLGGCSFGRTQQGDLLKTYRNRVEMQKAPLAKEEENQIMAPKLGAEEYERLGNLYLTQGNMDLAFLQFDKARRVDPSRIHIRYKLGRLLLQKGILEEARKEFEEIIKVTPNYALAYEGMGRAVFEIGNLAEAERNFQQALRLDAGLWQAHNFLAIIYDLQAEYERAVNEYKTAILLKPKSFMLYNNLGTSLILKGDYEEAISAFTEALRIENSNKRIHNNLALALCKLKRYQEAFEAFRKGGDEASAYYNLGHIYMQRGMCEEAKQAFEKAIETNPNSYVAAHKGLERAKSIACTLGTK